MMVVNKKRYKELMIINKILAGAVVGLALTSGLLLAERQSWLGEAEKNIDKPVEKSYPLPHFNGIIVSPPQNSPLANLLRQARFSWKVDAGTIPKETFLALVWAVQGQITEWGERTVPSYKSQFPLELVIQATNVEGVNPGWYRFDAGNQELIPETATAITQPEAAAVFILRHNQNNSASQQMIWHEAGAAAQNLLLMAQEKSLAAVFSLDSQEPNDSSLWKISIGKGSI